MDEFSGIGKILVISGILLFGIGVVILIFGKIPFLGKLPGDFSFKGENWSFHFALATSLLISILISLILYIVRKFF